VSPAHGGAQDPVRVVMVEDFTERRAMEERLRLSARVLESTNEGVLVTDAGQRIVHVNPAFTRLTGYAADEVIGAKPSVLASGRHAPDFYASMHHVLNHVGSWQGEIWNRKKSGEMFAEWLNISAVRDEAGQVTHYVAVFSDITLRKRNEERLNHQANHDPLTNLPNRTLFHERLNRALARAGRTRQTVALLFIDLDHFKEVNDSRGHLVGDMLLQAVAERLGSSTRQGDTVARLAGDEFTVILEEIVDFRDAAVVAQKMVHRLAEPFELGGQRLSLTTSVGIALFPSDSTDGHSLLRKADEAMYRAKKQGKNGYQFHDETLNVQAFERLALESSLRHALDRDEFTLYYQPIHETATGRIVAAEALLRWNHPEAGLALPAQFLSAALEAGLMLPIGRWVLTAACRQLALWKASGLDIRLSINLAHQQLHQFDLVETIAETLRQTGADPARLEIELAEGALFGAERTQEALPVLQRLRGLGVRVSVDDFGTGYSSFGQLRRLPLDALKIDQSFVRDIGNDADDARIITAIVAIAHSLRLGVIAEGVETSEQLAFLRRQNCELAQGFLFSRPMPIRDFDLLVAKPATVPA
ncbi:MAG: EAL domain-containing protein, partial [Alphaproteobacteria bacterium]|nr:EAL domain-containing protein [Alphaproteobacteria bacterium]